MLPRRKTRAALVAAVMLAGSPVLAPPAPAQAAKAGSCTIVGTAGDDVLVGTDADDVICGLGGDDEILGQGGDDVLRGGGGIDVVRGGPGDDQVAGGRGGDRVFGQSGDDVVRGDSGDDEVVGGPGNDRLGGFRGADEMKGDGDAAGFVDDVRCGPGPDTASADPADEVRRDCETVTQNDPPTDITLAPSTISENEPVGTDIGELTAVDPDPGDSHTFALVPGAGSADNALVRVDGDSLESAAGYDFENDSSLSVRVRATDDGGESTEKAFTVTVTDANDAPVAVDDDATTTEDTQLDMPVSGAGSPAANDTDQDGDPLTVSAVTNPTGGTVSISGGQVHFVPATNLCGNNAGSFGYTVSDGGGTDTGTVTVDITCVDDAPNAVDDARTVGEDSGATALDVLTNDTDPESDPITIASFTDPAGGTVLLVGPAGAGTNLTYTPDPDFCNDPPPFDTFTYTVNGGDTATVRVTVTCVNDAPVAVDDDRTTDEDTSLQNPVTGAGSPAANDTDDDAGDTLTVTAVTNPTGGTVGIASGQITFTPTANLCGNDAGSYDYTVSDGATPTAGTDTGRVTIDITCVNDAPVANDDSRTVAEDSGPTTFGTLLDNDTDVESDPITITGASNPPNGSTTFTAGDVTYTPDANFCGPDSFTYTVNGGDTATVSVTVTCVNDAPVAVDDTKAVGEDDSATAIDVLGNDTDVEPDAITVSSASDPANGTVVLTGGSPGVHTGLTYAPDPNYCNDPPGTTLDTFTYTINGGDTATVTVTVTCVDDAPVAVDDTASLTMDDPATPVPVLANDTDIDAGPKAISAASDPANGTVVLTGGASGAHDGLTYQPDPGYCNTESSDPDDTFTYTLTPGGDTATVSVEVACDVPPVGVDDSATVGEDSGPNAIDVLANDTNPDGGAKVIVSTTDPANGTVVLTGGGPGAHTGLTYQPDPNYCNSPPGTSPDTFTYTLNGGDTATVSVAVTCADDAPVAVDDTSTVDEDSGANTVDVLANDTDVDGGTKTVQSVSGGADGSPSVTNGGADVSYSPDPNFCGSDSFTYTLNGGDVGNVSVTVTCVADAPTVDTSAGATTFTEGNAPTAVDSALTIANPDGLTITGGSVSVTANAAAGDVLDWTDNSAGDSITEGASTSTAIVLTGNGSAAEYQAALRAVTYANTSQDPATAARTVTFSVTTSAGDATDTKTVQVVAVDDPPVAVNDSATVLEDSAAAAVPVLTNDTDVDGGPKTISSASDPANGTVVLTGGSPGAHTGLTYQPDPNYCNDPPGTTPDTFTYTINGGSNATVSMTVTCVNDAPVADDETFNGADSAIGNTSLVVDDPTDGAPDDPTGPQKSITGDILAGDTDIEGDTLAVVAGTFNSGGGTVVMEADGDFTVFPSAGCAASYAFDYTVTDGDLTDTGTVTVALTECVWYVDASVPVTGDGRSHSPLKDLSTLNGVGGAGDVDGLDDYLFVYGGGAFTTGIIMETNQRLYGQPEGLTVAGAALVAAGGTNPNIQNTAAGGNGVTLANGVDVQAVNVGVTGAGSTFGIRGIAVTTATVGSDVLVQGNGIGVGLQSAAAGNVTVGATINGNNNAAVSVQHRTGGTVTFTGDVTTAGINTTVELVGNTGATVNLTGQLTLAGSSTSVPGFDARLGGTVTATNAANQITGFTGTGLNLDGVTIGGGGITFNTVSSAGGGAINGIVMNNASGGAVTINGGTLVTSNRGVDVNAGSGDVTIGATLNPTGGRSVEITNRTGGLVDLNGPVNEDATGINLDNNDGSTVRFDGGITASTGVNAAFTAVNGGTVVVTDPNAVGTTPDNTLTTTTGTALNVVNTTIGDDDLRFRKISSNGAVNGIHVSNTANSNGRLFVTGNGGACTSAATCSGAAIQNSTQTGVVLNGVPGGAELMRLAVTDSADHGVSATNVSNGILLDRSFISSNGNAVAENGLEYSQVTGVTAIRSSDIIGSGVNNDGGFNARITNTSGTLHLTVNDTDFNLASTDDGLQIGAHGTATIRSNITGNRFDDNKGDAFQVADGAAPGVTSDHTFTGNTIDGKNLTATDGGIAYSTDGSSRATFNNNTITNVSVSGIILNPMGTTAATSFDATASNNTIGTAGIQQSGSVDGDGMQLKSASEGTSRIVMSNNSIHGWQGAGMRMRASEAQGGATTHLTAQSNTIGDEEVDAADAGIWLQAGSSSTDNLNLCANVGGGGGLANTFTTAPVTGAAGIADFVLDLRFANSLMRVPNYTGTTVTDRQNYFLGRNGGFTSFAQDGAQNMTNEADGACDQPASPTLPTAPPAIGS